MRESPRTRRLRSDLKALTNLKADSTILDFTVPGPMFGGPPEVYNIRFNGDGLQRPLGGRVQVRDQHELSIQLGASYPRMMPELHWKTPIFHPNISASGAVCLGGYGTHWVPSVSLDELCEMLWDMIRYQNYDVDSPYNREAALWAKTQSDMRFPIDARSIRDRVTSRAAESPHHFAEPSQVVVSGPHAPDRLVGPAVASPHRSAFVSWPALSPPAPLADEGIFILDDANPQDVVEAELVEAELVAADEPDILFLN